MKILHKHLYVRTAILLTISTVFLVFIYIYYTSQQINIEPRGLRLTSSEIDVNRASVYQEGNTRSSTSTFHQGNTSSSTSLTSADRGKWVNDTYQGNTSSSISIRIPTRKWTIDTEKAMPDLDKLWDRLVIVTAISENHLKEAKGMIGTAQQFMPGKKIILYDLGLRNETLPKIRKFCNVELRTFNFSRYPPHTANLMKYAWKVFIIRETLHEFGAIFWGDASVRFRGSLRDVLPYIHLHHGYMSHIHSYDPKVKSLIKHQYYYTHPNMYSKFNISRDEYYNEVNAAPHMAAIRQLIVNNSVLIEKLLDPLTECAMIEKCIEPEGAAYGIHRYDASALALLIYTNLRYEWTPENHNTSSAVLDKVCTTERTTKDGHLVKTC